jgi:Flp pilus assembly protein protease CpaA
LYAQALIAASLFVASFQDVRDRAVSDLVWVPAGAGVVLVIFWSYPATELFQLAKVAVIGGIALGFAYMGGIGEADAIAMAVLACDPYPLSPILPLVASGVVAASHIAYELAAGNAGRKKTIPIEQFLKEQRWIPKGMTVDGQRVEVSDDVNDARDEVEAKQKPGASVEVSYGVPTVAYLGAGYALFLVYLFIFNQSWLLRF